MNSCLVQVSTLSLCLSRATSQELHPPSSSKLAELIHKSTWGELFRGYVGFGIFLGPRCLSKTRQSFLQLNSGTETINTPCYTSASIVARKIADRTSWEVVESVHLLEDQI